MQQLKKQWSADDLQKGSSTVNIMERRARSASPTKNRPLSNQSFDFQSLLPSPPKDSCLHDDIASKISNGSLSPEQIRRLSKSPIAKKLHISSSQYALPIPFKLQLPPRLSSKSAPASPEPSRGRVAKSIKPAEKALPPSPGSAFPRKLVFNGAKYEPADSSESEQELSFLKPSTPQKPPATITNRKKVARFAIKHQSMPSDQLSMIEEASNAGSFNSRASSTRSKTLPTLPKASEANASPDDNHNVSTGMSEPFSSPKSRNVSRKPPPDLESPIPVALNKPKLDLVPPPPPPIQLPTSVSTPMLSSRNHGQDNWSSADSSFSFPRKLETRVVTEAPRRRPDSFPSSSTNEIEVFPKTPEPVSSPDENVQNKSKEDDFEVFPSSPNEESSTQHTLKHSHACHHNLNLGDSAYLKISKRNFSDESKVSSISSFSSLGDALNLDRDPAVRLFNRDQTALSANIAKYLNEPRRGSSTRSAASTRSDASQSSWNSLQRSVDFSIRESASSSERSSLSSKSKKKAQLNKELPLPPEELELEGDSLSEHFEIPRHLNIAKKESMKSPASNVCEVASGTSEKELDIVSKDDVHLESMINKPIEDKLSESEKSEAQENAYENEERSEDNEEEEEGGDEESEFSKDSASSLDDGNSGVGRGFSFPNDMSNITNSEEAKRRLEHQRHINGSSRRQSLNRKLEQIEIPNLDDPDTLRKFPVKETRHHGISFNDLQQVKIKGLEKENDSVIEPIGIPSSAAKQHFSQMYGGSSDSDSSFEASSKTSKPYKAPLSNSSKPMPSSVSLAAIASRKSPIRHARHRSMYNFDFADIFQEPSPQSSAKTNGHLKGHKASKSISVPSEASKEAKKDKTKNATADAESFPAEKPPQSESDKEQPLNIVVAEPPKRVEYAVDFRDATAADTQQFSSTFGNAYYQRQMSTNSRRNLHTPSVNSNSRSSQSKFSDSLVTARETISTAPTDTDSITIDLTKEEYNVCMIKRSDSLLSYRSVIEKRDGKPVEVVLVDEDDNQTTLHRPTPEERDDLSSIYSRYMTGWERMKRPMRTPSQKSAASEASDVSGKSWANSESGFQVKTLDSPRHGKGNQQIRKATMPNINTLREYPMVNKTMASKRVQSTPKLGKGPSLNRETNVDYFDYNGTEKYDFDSFMKQRL
ncbi:hypothetical protein ACI3LY_003826 [Candidozyma auris]|uniref:Uncharacterized protein n=2 Tax=Candidozyma auris TaxID=498019 RepID=A0AB36W978_CANAR|nr:hypothetical protein QG37_04283 [[Candida] auris]PIS56165.1 hypothetical protein CJI97_001411 [[Candida] auris]PIS56657.1 hypothetical protein B9J08_001195 [[Candida] auris]QWW24065.1 hypothetical protein CA7LBN_002899 [[Candida] auris]